MKKVDPEQPEDEQPEESDTEESGSNEEDIELEKDTPPIDPPRWTRRFPPKPKR